MADDVSDFGHQLGHLFPFIRQQVVFELRMDGPLGVNVRSSTTHKNMEEFYLSRRRVGNTVIGRIVIRLAWS